jgi:hypothetical protein
MLSDTMEARAIGGVSAIWGTTRASKPRLERLRRELGAKGADLAGDFFFSAGGFPLRGLVDTRERCMPSPLDSSLGRIAAAAIEDEDDGDSARGDKAEEEKAMGLGALLGLPSPGRPLEDLASGSGRGLEER